MLRPATHTTRVRTARATSACGVVPSSAASRPTLTSRHFCTASVRSGSPAMTNALVSIPYMSLPKTTWTVLLCYFP